MRNVAIVMMGACCLILTAGSALGEIEYVDRIPNGVVNGCTTCHLPDFSALNEFGVDFGATNPGDPLWTLDLANMDSDNDSYTNGIELLDPAGTWVQGNPDPGDPADVTNPGDENSVAIAVSTWGAVKDLFKE